ncbi:MAG: GntR family transcriptional regulator [Spirochaetales bacterium]|jgi:DNA-binding transcriptional regulator YhcF (GntR family)|nr:GntR family transcriptional regulator [Spirochaetales bacterium]
MEFRQNQAIYLQIADHISERILSGTWKEGERIPSIREMSESIEVNPNTVMRSYGYLQNLDIIYNQRGIGYFVAEDAYDKTLEQKKRSFIRRELPRIFRTMDLLHLTCKDLKVLYEENAKVKSAHSN